ncbi:CoA transferase subunit A [Candidatus Poribacteria bacterium]|nr:CoA transferase subunit A [Candidatus Poribacteria bacterium]
MLDKVNELEIAVRSAVRSGQTLMVGGFGRGGVPFSILEYLAGHAGEYHDLTLIKNDANEPNLGIGMLLANGQVKRLISTHIGLNPDFIAMMNRGEVACELVPQGIFAERIRAGGAGIPAFLTDIGMGTIVAEGKPTVRLDGAEYVLERALRGDVALVCADIADRAGNAWWRGSNRNMCVVMATACGRVIVEAKRIVERGEIEPEDVHLPSVFVDAVVQALPRRHQQGKGAA